MDLEVLEDRVVPATGAVLSNTLIHDTLFSGTLHFSNDAGFSVLDHTDVSHGTLTLDGNDYTYQPAYHFTGIDSFLCLTSSPDQDTPHNLLVTFHVLDDAPIAADDAYTLNGPALFTGDQGVLGNDHDPNSDTMTVSLVAGAANGSLDLHADGSFAYSASSGFTGVDHFSYTVSDGILTNTPATVTLTVESQAVFTWTQQPNAVAALSLSPQTNAEGDVVSLNVFGYGPAGDFLHYAGINLPAGVAIDRDTGHISGSIGYQAAEQHSRHYAFTILAVDEQTGGSSATPATWTVTDTLSPPVLTQPADQFGRGFDTVSLPIVASQADGDPLFYTAVHLPAGLSIDPDTGVISGTLDPAAYGMSPSVTVTVTDATPSTPQTASATFFWSIGHPVSTGVSFTRPDDQNNAVGESVDLLLNASDPGFVLTYSYAMSNLPDGLSLDPATGEISGTLTANAYQTTPYSVSVIASDDAGGLMQTFYWTVGSITSTNPGDQTNREGDAVSLTVTGLDANPLSLSYSATGLPGGLSIDSVTGVISGTVAAGASIPAIYSPTPFSYTVAVTATDGTDSKTVSFYWTIQHANNQAPVLTAPIAQVNVVGDSVTLNLTATDAENDALFYSADGLPDGLDINNSTGVISGTVADYAAQSTPYPVTVTVDDGNGGVTTQTFNWTVNNSTLTFYASTFTTVEGSASVVTIGVITDTDPNWDPSAFTVTINWGDGASDQGDINGADGSYTVTGSHAYAHPGSYTTQICVSDGTTQVQDSATAIVYAPPLNITGNFVAGTVVGSSVSGVWASIGDPNLTEVQEDFTAVIQWGDETESMGTVTGAAGQFFVTGNHAYADKGTHSVLVTITNPDYAPVEVTSTAQVGDLYAGLKSTLTVATFTTTDTTLTADELTATINWGDDLDGTADHSADEVTVTGGNGVFTVQGKHAYSGNALPNDLGTYAVQETLTMPNYAPLTATNAVTVVDSPLTVYSSGELGQSTPGLNVYDGVEVAAFTVPDRTLSQSAFAAVVYWGDGTNSIGSITGELGLFHIAGSHTYDTSGVFHVEVEVSQAGTVDTEYVSLVSEAVPEPVVRINSITVTEKGKAIGAIEGDVQSLGTFSGPNRIGWAFKWTVEANGDISKATVTQKISSLIVFSSSTGEFALAKLKDATHKDTEDVKDPKEVMQLEKNWENNKITYTQDGPDNIVNRKQSNIIRGAKSIEFMDIPGYGGSANSGWCPVGVEQMGD